MHDVSLFAFGSVVLVLLKRSVPFGSVVLVLLKRSVPFRVVHLFFVEDT